MRAGAQRRGKRVGKKKKIIHSETLAGGGIARAVGSGVEANRPKRRLNFYRPTFFSFTGCAEGVRRVCAWGEEGSIKTETTPTRWSGISILSAHRIAVGLDEWWWRRRRLYTTRRRFRRRFSYRTAVFLFNPLCPHTAAVVFP